MYLDNIIKPLNVAFVFSQTVGKILVISNIMTTPLMFTFFTFFTFH